MIVISLFSGIGGLELGFKRQGAECILFVENNIYCQEVLKKNFPGTKILSDVRDIEWNNLKLSQWDFPAKILVRQEKEKELLENVQDYGNKVKKQLGFYDQTTQSLRTFQSSLIEDSMLSLQTLPRSGMMQNGLLYQLKTSEHHIEEKEYSLLPTLVSSDSFTCDFKSNQVKEGSKHSLRLHQALLPTIGANEYRGSSKNRYKGSKDFHGAKMSEGLRTSKDDQIYLNPYFAEVVMGFPIGWTELDAVGTQSFLKSQNLLRKELKKSKIFMKLPLAVNNKEDGLLNTEVNH